MTACRDCALLDGQGPSEPPHSQLKLVRRSRHQAVLALFFQCSSCAAELSFLPGRTVEQHGWRMFATPNRGEPVAEAA